MAPFAFVEMGAAARVAVDGRLLPAGYAVEVILHPERGMEQVPNVGIRYYAERPQIEVTVTDRSSFFQTIDVYDHVVEIYECDGADWRYMILKNGQGTMHVVEDAFGERIESPDLDEQLWRLLLAEVSTLEREKAELEADLAALYGFAEPLDDPVPTPITTRLRAMLAGRVVEACPSCGNEIVYAEKPGGEKLLLEPNSRGQWVRDPGSMRAMPVSDPKAFPKETRARVHHCGDA